jgi:glucose-6-phosphate 1-dehydrogenase
MTAGDRPLTIVVVGGSGDLARKKIIPALFALYCQRRLQSDFRVVGFARSAMSDDAFRDRIREHLTCRYSPGESCADRMHEFLGRCFFVSGAYGSTDAILDLYVRLRDMEKGQAANRLFYLAIPPSLFAEVAGAIGDAGLVQCGETDPWSRVVVEKPFGRDRTTSDVLTAELAGVFSEEQTYRIDHYLGKEVVQNLMVLRFANRVFEPLWNRGHVDSVAIAWKEPIGVEGRAGYFDAYGIIRDVLQNHLLQIMSLVAMETPRSLGSHFVRDEKVKVLQSIPPVSLDNIVTGQYVASENAGVRFPGYRDDPAVPRDSRTPTFAAVALQVRNPRWEGVPFFLSAGKGLDAHLTEVRIRFRPVAGNLFCRAGECPDVNELVIRVQPDESVFFRVVSKVPGVEMKMESRPLDLRYRAAFKEEIPEAYESLLLDVILGNKGLFIRSDELAAAWDVFTPVLAQLDERRVVPEPYAFGSHGPASAAALAARCRTPW